MCYNIHIRELNVESLTSEKKLLIEKCIKNNKKFQNNEDLYEDFYNETYKNSLTLLTSISSEATMEIYLKRVVTSAMINVLKNSGRIRRTAGGYKATPTESLEALQDTYNADFAHAKVVFKDVEIEENPEDAFMKREVLKNITQILNQIEVKEPEKQYLTLFKLRYEDGLTQNEIALKLGISQSEVSKKLFKLMGKVREELN